MKDAIRLEYVENKKTYQGKISRREFLEKMKWFVEEFPDNNRIATKFVSIIPQTVYVKINNDVNQTQDIPYILYMKRGESFEMLKIPRIHRRIWNFLKSKCEEVKS